LVKAGIILILSYLFSEDVGVKLGIDGRVAIVTGGSAGVGLAISRELLENGASVAVIGRNQARLEKATAQLRADVPGGKVLAFAADVTLTETPAMAVKKTIATFGRIDILVNNAGRAQAGNLMSSTEEQWSTMTDVKLTALRRFCKEVIPVMQAAHWGRIVNISSIGGIYPNPKLFISHVLSAAIDNFTKSLALEVASDGILVNAIALGAIATGNWAANMLPAIRKVRLDLASLDDAALLARVCAEYTPVGRAGQPEEIAAIAAFLASARNGFVTGNTIEASGGADRFM
jgi:3-oxoacyl-[acyl-carrier protein] reductase